MDAMPHQNLAAEKRPRPGDKIRILNVEDNVKDSELIRLSLEREGICPDLLRVDTEPDFVNALCSSGFDLVIADFTLPSFNGWRSLELARRLCPETPFLFFTGTLGEEAAVESLKNGATDYVLKQRPARLIPAVRRALAEAETQIQKKRTEDALRQAQIELNRKRDAHEQELCHALAEKETLLQEIHHRVKNNLQIVSSLLHLQAKSLPKAAQEMLYDTQSRVRAMALVHEQLYQQGNNGDLSFSMYARKLANELWDACKDDSGKVLLRFDLEPVQLDVNRAVPCGLILNELLINSLKHAFPNRRNGEILVALRCDPKNQVELRVADNGIGLPEGLDWERTNSLGLRMVNVLARQLGASLKCEARKGVDFRIIFQREEAKPTVSLPDYAA